MTTDASLKRGFGNTTVEHMKILAEADIRLTLFRCGDEIVAVYALCRLLAINIASTSVVNDSPSTEERRRKWPLLR